LKIAVTGKGGAGKTTIVATLARLLGRSGFNVLAIDADLAMGLAADIGIPGITAKTILPISDNPDLVEERTGARPGETSGAVFNLTPQVEDLASRFGVLGPDGTRLLVLGTVKSAGSGCMCPANALLRTLLRHILSQKGEAIVMDMEAGLEHLGRGVVRGVDAILTVLEPRPSSLRVYESIAVLARQLGIRNIMPVGNKIGGTAEEEFLRQEVEALGDKLAATIPYDTNIIRAEMSRIPLLEYAPDTLSVKALDYLKQTLIVAFAT
jgi:CO dehydrogenase maturation factor